MSPVTDVDGLGLMEKFHAEPFWLCARDHARARIDALEAQGFKGFDDDADPLTYGDIAQMMALCEQLAADQLGLGESVVLEAT